jgi:hypothetical protein
MSKLITRWTAALLLAAGVGLQVGCRACGGACDDYASPVANCECSGCSSCGSGGRAGSVQAYSFAKNEDSVLEEEVEVARLPEATLQR